jgi:hypothetical protein
MLIIAPGLQRKLAPCGISYFVVPIIRVRSCFLGAVWHYLGEGEAIAEVLHFSVFV